MMTRSQVAEPQRGGMEEAKPAKATCPRCGYDLTGATRQWTDRCPTQGLCTECGLEFDWQQVFVLTEHPWLFEYHWRRRPIWRLLRTVWRSLRPWSFWRDVRMNDPIYLLPAAVVWTTCLITGLLAAYASIVSSRHSMFSSWFGGPTSDWPYWKELLLETLRESPMIVWMRVSGALSVLVAMPIVFTLLPATLRRARVRRAHVLRIWMYSLSFLTVLAILWLAVDAVCEWLELHRIQRIIDPWRWGSSRFYYDAYGSLMRQVVAGSVVAGVAACWMMFFWYFAIKRYLKLPHAGAVAIALGLIVFGFAMVLESLKWPAAY